jgi:ADP-ribose pyrophosphatase YjhB (NUDIX family)
VETQGLEDAPPLLVKRLARVCNHPGYEPPDALFSVRLRIGSVLARAVGWEASYSSQRQVSPETLYRCFDYLRDHAGTDDFRVNIDFARHEATIDASAESGGFAADVPVAGRHIIGAFALMTREATGEHSVVLKHKGKRPWPYDVPGGKISVSDVSVKDAVSREVFEEMGIVLEHERLSEPIAVKYDKRSQKEGVPVIAVYCHYKLTDIESRYFDEFLPPDAGPDGYPLVPRAVDELINAKRRLREERSKDLDDAEAECHAPLEAIEWIAQWRE